MTFLRTTIFLYLICVASLSYGQTDCDSTLYPKLLNNSFQCKWIFFKLTDTIQGIVIKHENPSSGCGVRMNASLTIIKTEDDTIRVLFLCNRQDYKIGQKVKILPSQEPSGQVDIPSFTSISGYPKQKMTKSEKDELKKEIEKEASIFRSNEFDEKVMKTTWGVLTPYSLHKLNELDSINLYLLNWKLDTNGCQGLRKKSIFEIAKYIKSLKNTVTDTLVLQLLGKPNEDFYKTAFIKSENETDEQILRYVVYYWVWIDDSCENGVQKVNLYSRLNFRFYSDGQLFTVDIDY